LTASARPRGARTPDSCWILFFVVFLSFVVLSHARGEFCQQLTFKVFAPSPDVRQATVDTASRDASHVMAVITQGREIGDTSRLRCRLATTERFTERFTEWKDSRIFPSGVAKIFCLAFRLTQLGCWTHNSQGFLEALPDFVKRCHFLACLLSVECMQLESFQVRVLHSGGNCHPGQAFNCPAHPPAEHLRPSEMTPLHYQGGLSLSARIRDRPGASARVLTGDKLLGRNQLAAPGQVKDMSCNMLLHIMLRRSCM